MGRGGRVCGRPRCDAFSTAPRTPRRVGEFGAEFDRPHVLPRRPGEQLGASGSAAASSPTPPASSSCPVPGNDQHRHVRRQHVRRVPVQHAERPARPARPATQQGEPRGEVQLPARLPARSRCSGSSGGPTRSGNSARRKPTAEATTHDGRPQQRLDDRLLERRVHAKAPHRARQVGVGPVGQDHSRDLGPQHLGNERHSSSSVIAPMLCPTSTTRARRRRGRVDDGAQVGGHAAGDSSLSAGSVERPRPARSQATTWATSPRS